MLISVQSQLRRHHRLVVALLVTLALAVAALAAHSALMSGGMSGQAMGDAAAICLTVGGSLMLGATVFVAARGAGRGPTWPLVQLALPASLPSPSPAGFLVRAAPPPLLQVFRL